MFESVISSTWSIVTSGISLIIGVLSWFIVFLYVIFIMLDYERLSKRFSPNGTPPTARRCSASATTSSAR